MNKIFNNILVAAGVSLLFAGSYIGAKYLQGTLQPYAFTAARLGFATLFLLPFVTFAETRWLTQKRLLMFLGVGFFGSFLTNHLFSLAVRIAPSANIAIINATLPIMVLIASCFLVRRFPTFNELGAILCSFVGVILIIGKHDVSSLFALQKGELFMLLSNVAGVANILLLQTLSGYFTSIFITALGSIIGMMFLLPLGLNNELITGLGSLGYFQWAMLIATSVLCTALPLWGQARAIATLGASMATFIIMGLVPIFVSILAFFFFGEPITWLQVLGAGFVITALYFGVRNVSLSRSNVVSR